MSKAGERTIKALEEAVAYAKGEPVDGTREHWYDHKEMRWRSRTFKDGKWQETE